MVLYKNIFLVDDDEDDRLFFRDALQEIDNTIKCDFAVNGKDALDHLNKLHQLPEVIFLDLNMPLMNGLECLSFIKKDIRLALLPVVIYTTSQNVIDVEATHSLGANVYLTKPSSFDELKTKVQRILNLKFRSTDEKVDVLFQYTV